VTALTSPESKTVHLRNLPLRLHGRAREHHQELLREFALITIAYSDVPSRLLELSADLQAQYARESAQSNRALEEAMERGDRTLDMDVETPIGAGVALAAFAALLDEADEYCRQGELLTLANPPELVAYRRWYLDEFARQLGGAPPRPWDGPLD